MGNGHSPGSANELNDPIVVDDGTLARAGSPSPGPIGLDAKGGTKQSQPSMADRIVAFARQRRGERVGNGQCFALADQALRNAGAKGAAEYGEITPDADYVWGNAVSASDLRPGDVIQLRDYRYDRTVSTENPDGSGSATDDFKEHDHHTAVVERVDGNGAVTVLQQNAPDGAPVSRSQLFFSNGTTTNGNRTTTVRVQGTWWFYRPQPR